MNYIPPDNNESLVKAYHEWCWKPCSAWLDRKIKRFKILRVLKKAFDVHFNILGLLGICATPPDDVDCYCYICKRTKNHKYKHLGWKKRWQLVMILLRKVKKA